jgi:hypothetical protein
MTTERADVWMRDERDRTSFAIKTLPEVRIGSNSIRQNFDSDCAVQPRVLRFV